MTAAGRALGAPDRCALLARSRSIAVVGASADPERPSHRIFTYLNGRAGLGVTPINPDIVAIGDVRAYPTLAAFTAERGVPDIVNVFRKPSEAAGVTRAAIACGARAIWFQLGVASDEALLLAGAAGLVVVAQCCIKVEWSRCDAEHANAR